MKKLIFLALSLTFFASCTTSDSPFVEEKAPVSLENGILFLNEGNYLSGNASLGFISTDFSEIVENIAKNNNDSLGDVAQSLTFYNNKAFIVLNNSNKIEVFDRYTFKHENTIESNLNQPRYITFSNNKMYVTNYGSQSVTIYNANSFDFLNEISLNGPVDNITTLNRKIYIQKAAFSEGNEIVIVDDKTDGIVKTIQVEDKLQSIVAHSDFIYAISSINSRSHFYKIDAQDDQVITHFLSTKNMNAQNLRADENILYYTSNNQVYQWFPNDTTVQLDPVLTIKDATDLFATFYGFNVIDSRIYVADAGNYTQASKISIYNLKGDKLKSFYGGILTNQFYKNYKLK